MLADMAAVHRYDARYRDVVADGAAAGDGPPDPGDRADEHADRSWASGAVKITPGHDFQRLRSGRSRGLQAGCATC
jgi:valyl-tRNA synthetase